MKTLLVPTNFSIQSDNAILYAVEFGEKLNAKITLFHAYHTFPDDHRIPFEQNCVEPALIRHQSETELKKRCLDIGNKTSLPCDFINLEGLAQEAIIDQANTLKPEILIVGTEKHTPIQRMSKTKTEKVIQNVDCSVMSVPLDKEYTAIRKIAFAIYYHASEIDEIRYLLKIAEKFDAEIHIIHVVRSMDNVNIERNYFEAFKEEVQDSIPDQDFVFCFIKGDNISEELEHYVEDAQIDLIAVTRSKKNVVDKMLSTGVSTQLYRNLNIPLLVLNMDGTALN